MNVNKWKFGPQYTARKGLDTKRLRLLKVLHFGAVKQQLSSGFISKNMGSRNGVPT